MQFGIVSPHGTAAQQVERAVLAEEAGWDAIFVWEGAYQLDAWALLAAMAVRTSKIRLGTMLTPLPWRRPWTIAAQAATVDQLSRGRVILSVATGAPEAGRIDRNEPESTKERTALLEEGLEVITSLWSGRFDHAGEHFSIIDSPEPPRDLRPVQQPRIPIWVVGAWHRSKSMARAVKYDAVIPYLMDEGESFGATFAEMSAWVAQHRRPDGSPVDVIYEGVTPADDPGAAKERVDRWAERGATWWVESMWGQDEKAVDHRVAAGPPR